MEQVEAKKKIYVSASWEDRYIAKTMMDFLEDNGFGITEDWTKHEHTPPPEIYVSDREGIKNCDYFILLNGYQKTTGKFWECGLADAWGKLIISAGIEMKSPFKHGIAYTIKGRIYDDDMPSRILDALNEIMVLEASGLKLISVERDGLVKIGEPIPREKIRTMSPAQISEMTQNMARKTVKSLGRYDEEYNNIDTCVICNKRKFVSAGTGSCMDCDGE